MKSHSSLPEPGIYFRAIPRHEVRVKRLKELKKKHASKRKPNDWWILGTYTLYDALLDEDDGSFQEAIEFYKIGADAEPPSFACMLDLAWTFNQKNFPYYCIHSAFLNELLPYETFGYLLWPTDEPQSPGDICK